MFSLFYSERKISRNKTPKGQSPQDEPLPSRTQQKNDVTYRSNRSTADDNSRYTETTKGQRHTRDRPKTGDVINNNEVKSNPTRSKPKPDLQLKNQPHDPSNSVTNQRSRRELEHRKLPPVKTENALLQEIHDFSGNWKDGVKALHDQSRGKTKESATGESWDINKAPGVYRKLPFQQNMVSSSKFSGTVAKKDVDNADKSSLNKTSPPNLFPVSRNRQQTKPLPEISEGLPLRQQEKISKINFVKTDGATSNKTNRSSNKPKQPKPIWNATQKPRGKSKTELAKAYSQGIAGLQSFTTKPTNEPKDVSEEEKGVVLSRAPSRIDEIINDEQTSENEDKKPEPEEEIPLPDQPNEGLIIEVSNSDISDLDLDVLVSVDSEDLQGTGKIAQELDSKGGEDFVVLKTLVMQMCQRTIPEWEFYVSPGDGDLTCERVFHAHVPSIHKIKNQAAWCSHLGILVWNLMTRADYMGLSSMALPLLGSGRFWKKYFVNNVFKHGIRK